MFKQKDRQSGAAAMITVVFVAIILSIMTISFIRLALNETRISTDDDLTTRAYYAAESGVEDAKRAIRAFQDGTIAEADLNADACALPTDFEGVLSEGADYDMEYICQFIEFEPASYQYHLDDLYQTIQVPIKAVDSSGNPASINQMRISWHINADSATGGDGIVGLGDARAVLDDSIPRVVDWGANYPAMLRANLISHETPIERDGIDNFIAYLDPSDGGLTATPVVAGNSAAFYNVHCNGVTADDMFCSVLLTGIDDVNRDYVLRLTNLYSSTHVLVEIFNGATQLNFSDAQAIVDVTGRAGSVYRRVESVIDLNSASILPNDAITSLKDICKDFIFTDNATDFNGIPGTSCTD